MDDNCPVCYEIISNINDISITVCNHKFHTRCVLRCNGVCPLCRTNLITNTNSNVLGKIPPGIYSISEYVRQLEQHNIPMDSVSHEMQSEIKDYFEYLEDMKLLEEQKKNRANKEKETLKKQDPNLYKLFYGK